MNEIKIALLIEPLERRIAALERENAQVMEILYRLAFETGEHRTTLDELGAAENRRGEREQKERKQAAGLLEKWQASQLASGAKRRGPLMSCWCSDCNPELEGQRMFLCKDCGNKRCPRAKNHNNACTNSNAPGQRGSSYEDCSAPSFEDVLPFTHEEEPPEKPDLAHTMPERCELCRRPLAEGHDPNCKRNPESGYRRFAGDPAGEALERKLQDNSPSPAPRVTSSNDLAGLQRHESLLIQGSARDQSVFDQAEGQQAAKKMIRIEQLPPRCSIRQVDSPGFYCIRNAGHSDPAVGLPTPCLWWADAMPGPFEEERLRHIRDADKWLAKTKKTAEPEPDDAPLCPYCGASEPRWRDESNKEFFFDGDQLDIKCPACGKPYQAFVAVSFSFTSQKNEPEE